MKSDIPWVPAAKRREIAEGKTPSDYEDRTETEVAAIVARILGTKTMHQQAAEPETGVELTKAEQRKVDARRAERDRRFGRA